MNPAGDVTVLGLYVLLWGAFLFGEAWLATRRRPAPPEGTTPALPTHGPVADEWGQAKQAAAALQAVAAETQQTWERQPPQPLGLRLTGTDAEIVTQLINATRLSTTRRSER